MQTKKHQRAPESEASALRKCEERFESFIELSSEGYWEQDENYRFTLIAGGTLDRSGIDPKTYIGTAHWDHGAVPIGDGGWDEHKATLEARRPFADFVCKHVNSRGELRYLSTSGQPIFDEKKQFKGYRGSLKDVTQRAQKDLRLAIEHAVTRILQESNSIAEASPGILRAICEALEWACGARWEPDELGQALRCADAWGTASPGIEAFLEVTRQQAPSKRPGGLNRRTWQERKPQWIRDVTQEESFRRAPDAARAGLHSAFAFPINVGAEVIGVMEFFSRKIHQPDAELLDCMTYVGSQIGQFIRRKQAEASVRESEERFRAIVDSANEGIVVYDRSLKIIAVNAAAERIIGLPAADMIGSAGFTSRLPCVREDGSPLTPEDRPTRITIRTGRPVNGALLGIKRPGGSVTWLSVNTGFLRRPGDADYYGVVSSFGDITAKRREEQLLRLEHTVTRSLAEADSTLGAIEAAIRAVCETEGWECGRHFCPDEKTAVMRFNAAWGVPSEAIERYIAGSRDVVYPPGVGLMGRVWQSGQSIWVSDLYKDARVSQPTLARESGIHGAFVFPVIAQGKTIGVLAFNSREARQPEERLLRSISVIGSQIGQFLQRKQAEEEMNRFRLAMDNSADMIALVDPVTMRYVDVNETECKLLGYSKEELLRMSPEDLLPISRAELERVYKEFIANPSRVSGLKSHYRCKDGSLLPFESTRRVLRSGGRNIIVVISRDIRERLAAEKELRESEERFRSLTNLSSDLYWEQDEQFRFTLFSGMGSERVNVRNLPYIGKKRWEQNYVNMTADAWAEHIALLEAHKPFRDLELCRLDEAGKKTWISISGEPVFDSSGAFKGYRGVGKDITERKLDEEHIQFLANHDALTALPNRAMFTEVLNLAIENARRYHRNFAVLFIDLDRFKIINDTLGHDMGDKLLQEMGKRLTNTVRASDVVARLGGDEFVVLVQEVSEPKQVATVARKILAALVQPMTMQGQECRVTASIGICMYPADAQDEQALMKNADIAMYRAKEDGKNTYKFYSEEINVHSFEKLALEASLRRGLERQEFLLHYQAKLDLHTGTITGVEALVRWKHPDLGMVPPGQFIPLAEETGLIVTLGKWVLNTACAQTVAWQRQGLPRLRMAVNLSARQFADDNLVEDIKESLATTGIDPELLELELTESMVIQNTERAGRVLAEIKRLGVRLAIDDFGVGYSSLSHLKRFPIDTLKVDRSFIRDIPQDPEDKAITEAIIAMGKSLSLTVVAEGVETLEQQDFLRDHACDEMQGFYFSKPIPPDQFAELIRKRVGDPKR